MAQRGHPPTQFKPGQSGNPSGRKAGSVIFREVIGDEAIRVFSENLKKMAENGDTKAAEMILDRVVPKIKEDPIKIAGFKEAKTLDDKAAIIMEAAANGDINPTQCEKFLNSLACRIKILESSVLIEQIETLKKAVFGDK